MPAATHRPDDPVDLDTVSLVMTPDGGAAETVFGPGPSWGAGWSGTAHPNHVDGSWWVFPFESHRQVPLAPSTTYTLEMTGQTVSGESVDPATASWSFSTRRDLSDAALTFDVDLDGPTVRWTGRFWGGTGKVTFTTSEQQDQEAIYRLMDEARVRAPDFMQHQRDTAWTGDYFRASVFDGNPNIVRHVETRRILAFEDLGDRTRLTLGDLLEGPLYGIAPGRPLSPDYEVGERVRVSDVTLSEAQEILAIDDAASTIDVTPLDTPAAEWDPGDPAAGPGDNPRIPDHFGFPLAALRKLERPGTQVYYWTRVHDELDRHVARGRSPLVRIDHVPFDLCQTGIGSGTWGDRCQEGVKSWLEWDEFVYALTDHLIERYGDVAADWYWSIGNEIALSRWWRQNFDEFLRYYDVTSNAVLRAFEDHAIDSQRIVIGGVEDAPAGRYLDRVLYHCSPDAENPSGNFIEENHVCVTPEFADLISARVAATCLPNEGRGCPFDFYSIHTYRHSLEAHEIVANAWGTWAAIDPDFFTPFRVNCHESAPDWRPRRDPAASNVFAASGFYPTWAADYFQRLLADAMADPRRAGGESTVTTWPFNVNLQGGTASVGGVFRLDTNGDGAQDDVMGVANTFFRAAELMAWMSHDLADIGAVEDAGARIGGWRSVEEFGDRILLHAHDRRDADGAETEGWQITLDLRGSRFDQVDVTEYRLDRDHSIRAAYDALPKRGTLGVYTPDEIADLLAADELTPMGPVTRHDVVDGRLTLTTFVQSQGITFLEVMRHDCAPDDPGSFSPPRRVTGLRVRGGAVAALRWDDQAEAVGDGVRYDVVSGTLDELWADSALTRAGCLQSGVTGTAFDDGRPAPAPGDGFYYLVRARNACGLGDHGPGRQALDDAPPCP